jgi:putative transposase
MGVDLNFNNITYTIINSNSELVSIGVVPFKGLKKILRRKLLKTHYTPTQRHCLVLHHY